jgi:hypothetical protein
MRVHTIMITLALGTAACVVGRKAETLPLAHSPTGAIANLDVNQHAAITGELLAAEDSVLLIRRGQTMLSIPYSQIRFAVFKEISERYSLNQSVPDPETFRKLRLISHFPQGLSPSVRQTLAAMYRADTLAR